MCEAEVTPRARRPVGAVTLILLTAHAERIFRDRRARARRKVPHRMDRLGCGARRLGRVRPVVVVGSACREPRHRLARLGGLAVADVARERIHADRREDRGEREEIHELDGRESSAHEATIAVEPS